MTSRIFRFASCEVEDQLCNRLSSYFLLENNFKKKKHAPVSISSFKIVALAISNTVF